MKLLLFLFIITTGIPGISKVQAKIINLNNGGKDPDYSFPYIKYSNNTVAKQINKYLQKTLLDNNVIEINASRIFKKNLRDTIANFRWMEWSLLITQQE